MFYQGKSKVLPHLFQPFHLGKLELRNRLVMPPMVTFLMNESGGVTQRMIDYYAERVRGGVGLITIESAYVLEKDRDMGRLGIEKCQLLVGLNELAEAIQEEGARAFLQLNHRGSVLSIHQGKGPWCRCTARCVRASNASASPMRSSSSTTRAAMPPRSACAHCRQPTRTCAW